MLIVSDSDNEGGGDNDEDSRGSGDGDNDSRGTMACGDGKSYNNVHSFFYTETIDVIVIDNDNDDRDGW